MNKRYHLFFDFIGVIAASTNNGEGIAGVAGISKGKVKIMAVKIYGFCGQYPCGSFRWALNGLNYALAQGAQISSNRSGLKLIFCLFPFVQKNH